MVLGIVAQRGEVVPIEEGMGRRGKRPLSMRSSGLWLDVGVGCCLLRARLRAFLSKSFLRRLLNLEESWNYLILVYHNV
jgi:hypothetical protein